jgi:hypothetical protein
MPRPKTFRGSARFAPVSNLVIIPPVVSSELREAAKKGEGTEFFQKFHLGDFIMFYGQPKVAYDEGLRILNECRQADLKAFSEIHKGGIYYWIGMAAFVVRDYETAVFFFDAAVSEDLRQGSDPINNSTPALKFIQVEGTADKQAAQPLVADAQNKIEGLIETYNESSGKPTVISDLDIIRLRTNFLQPAVSHGNDHWRSLATTFISYIIEWNDRNEFLDLRVGKGTAEPFYMHLFKGCVLFESLLKANPKKPPPHKDSSGKYLTLIKVLQYVHSELGIPHDIKIGENDLPTIITHLHTADNSLPTAIQFTGMVRNSVGHNLGWQLDLEKIDYQKLFTMIAMSNLHVINILY